MLCIKQTNVHSLPVLPDPLKWNLPNPQVKLDLSKNWLRNLFTLAINLFAFLSLQLSLYAPYYVNRLLT
jgi:hypothetical protein